MNQDTIDIKDADSYSEGLLDRELSRFDDRCDSCGAQAFVIAVKDSSELLFCGHHGRKFMDNLSDQGFVISDRTDSINIRPSISANSE